MRGTSEMPHRSVCCGVFFLPVCKKTLICNHRAKSLLGDDAGRVAPVGGWLCRGGRKRCRAPPCAWVRCLRVLLCLGQRIPPKIHPSARWERGIKPISGDGRRSFGSFPARRCPWCLQVCVKVGVKLENGVKKLCRRVTWRGTFPHPPPQVSHPVGVRVRRWGCCFCPPLRGTG